MGGRASTAEAGICRMLAELVPTLHHVFRRWQEVPISSQLEFIADHIEKGDDVAVGFRASDVYDGSKAVGHVALIESVDTKLDKVILIDPDMGTDEGVVVSWPRLFAGIASVSDGFWLFGGDPIVLKAQTTI